MGFGGNEEFGGEKVAVVGKKLKWRRGVSGGRTGPWLTLFV